MVDELAPLREALDALAAVDPNRRTDHELRELLPELHQLVSRATAIEANHAAVFEARKIHQAERFRTAAAWLAHHARSSKRSAGTVIRLGVFARDMDLIGEAWQAGEIDTEHVRTIRGVHNDRTSHAMRDQQKVLIDAARTITRFSNFELAVRYWHTMADPDGAEQLTEEQLSRNTFSMGRAGDGMLLGKFQLDTIGGTIVEATLKTIYDELFKQEWADTKARLDREPTVGELPRSYTQRMAAAFVEMARRARIAPRNGRKPAPLFTVLVGEQSLRDTCELSNRQAVTPGALVPYISEAEVERVVFDTPSRVIELGKRTRFFTGGLRRVIQVRDRHCQGPGDCDEPPEACEVDHIVPHGDGGETTQENGRLYCRYHNHNRPSGRDYPCSGTDG